MLRKTIIIATACLLCSLSATAQRLEIGAWLGTTHYFGDLNPNLGLNRPGIAGGGLLRYNFNPRISGKIGVSYGKISAYDSDSDSPFQKARNLSFRSDIFDATAQLEFNFMRYVHGSRDETFSPYMLLGFGVFTFSPQTQYQGKWISLAQLGTEGQYIGAEYSLVQPHIAYGMGIKWDLTREWAMNFELSSRKLFTDYLDDVSGNYTDNANLRSLRGDLAVALADRSAYKNDGKIGQPTRQRGDGLNEDTYIMVGLALVYNFNAVRCVNW